MNIKYEIDYIYENEFKKMERNLKKCNMLAYKKLYFDYYPKLEEGNFLGKLISINEENNTETYELLLPTDKIFSKKYGDIKLYYVVYKDIKIVMLDKLVPEDILSEGYQSLLVAYKDLMVSKANKDKDMFKINLLCLLDKKDKNIINNEYNFDYINEKEFKKMERNLKKCNMLAYKKLYFDYYPKLKEGKRVGTLINKKEKKYKLKLPTDMIFSKVHGDIILKYTVDINSKLIILEEIEPKEIFLKGPDTEISTHKGVMVSKEHPDKDIFTINLLNSINKD